MSTYTLMGEKKKDTHRERERHMDPHSLWTCLLLFPCQQQKRGRESERRSVEGGWWVTERYVLLDKPSSSHREFLWQWSLSEKGKRALSQRVTLLPLRFDAFMEQRWYVYVCCSIFSFIAERARHFLTTLISVYCKYVTIFWVSWDGGEELTSSLQSRSSEVIVSLELLEITKSKSSINIHSKMICMFIETTKTVNWPKKCQHEVLL